MDFLKQLPDEKTMHPDGSSQQAEIEARTDQRDLQRIKDYRENIAILLRKNLTFPESGYVIEQFILVSCL
jgi:hypothetical protein